MSSPPQLSSCDSHEIGERLLLDTHRDLIALTTRIMRHPASNELRQVGVHQTITDGIINMFQSSVKQPQIE